MVWAPVRGYSKNKTTMSNGRFMSTVIHCPPHTIIGAVHVTVFVSTIRYTGTLHIYLLCGIFYFSWHRHQVEGTNCFLYLSKQRQQINGVIEIAKSSK